MVTMNGNPSGVTYDGVPIPEACRRLEDAGACVVGVNCSRGPDTMIPLIKEVRKACKVQQLLYIGSLFVTVYSSWVELRHCKWTRFMFVLYIQGPIGCLPNPYRTNSEYVGMQQLRDERTGEF